ncbi:fungal specific transcription factor domain containing protein [Seiridium cupressi]
MVNTNTTTPTRAISKSPSSSHTTKPISELYVDRLLALARSTDMLKYNKPYTVKKNGLFAYFEQVHPFYPFLDRGSFESLAYGSELPLLLAQNKPWSALYHTVLALGCQVTGGGSFEPGKGEAWRLFSTSLAIFPDLMTLPDSLVLLQAMAAMTIYSVGISCLAVEHVILSEAARRAQSLGSTNLSGNASISYQRVFWVLYSVEKISSFHLGRNSVFFDHDIVSPVPNLPEAVFEGFDWFLTSVRYSRLLSRAMTSLFSAGVLGNPEDYYLAAIDQLTEELDKWRLSIPVHLRPGDNPGRRIAHLSSLIRVPTIWMSCLYNSFRLSLCRATLHLAAGAKEVVSPARQAAATRTMMETSRSTLELATFIDVEPYTPLWYDSFETGMFVPKLRLTDIARVLGGIPLTSHFILFDFVINNPKSPETATNLALLDIAGGHFSRIEYASGGCLPGSLIGEFAHIARDFVNSADCNGGNPPRRPPSPLAGVVGRTTASSPPASSPITGSDNDIYTETITNNPVSAIEAIPGLTINPFLTNDDLPLLDTLYFPINNDFIGMDGSSGMGTDIMNLFNTYIPGIDPVFLNQPIDGSFV